MTKFKLGSLAECTITGFKGILTARVEYLNGCVQYCIKSPIDKDGKIKDGEYFDESQINVIKTPPQVAASRIAEKKSPGGPQRDRPQT